MDLKIHFLVLKDEDCPSGVGLLVAPCGRGNRAVISAGTIGIFRVSNIHRRHMRWSTHVTVSGSLSRAKKAGPSLFSYCTATSGFRAKKLELIARPRRDSRCKAIAKRCMLD